MRFNHNCMKRTGRANWLVVLGLAGVVAIVLLAVLAPESPMTVATKFMNGLVSQDAEVLAQTTVLHGASDEQRLAAWKETVNTTRYYRFVWRPVSDMIQSDTTASVKIMMTRNADSDASYEAVFDIPLKREDPRGRWKVDASSLSREFYPFLPR